jgi:hypothetical protein
MRYVSDIRENENGAEPLEQEVLAAAQTILIAEADSERSTHCFPLKHKVHLNKI